MKTTSSKMLKVGLAVAEDANPREALSGIKLALKNNILELGRALEHAGVRDCV